MKFLLIIMTLVTNCAASLLIRKGMLSVGEVGVDPVTAILPRALTNGWLWLAMVCYALSAMSWIATLSKVEVSCAVPFLSLSYVIAAMIGWLWLGEHLGPTRIAGIAVICLGVFLISRS